MKNNSITGYASNQYELSHNSYVYIHNKYGIIKFTIKFVLIKSSIPILHIIDNKSKWSFFKNIKYLQTSIFESFGDVDYYSITPDLPEGMYFSKVTGNIWGVSNNTYDPIQYVISATNYNKEISYLNIFIEIITVYCEEEGEWVKTEVGERAYCDCESAGVKYRDCIWINNTVAWSEVVDNCYSKSNISTIIGIACGSLFAVSLTIFIVFYVMKSKKNKKSDDVVLAPLLTVQQEQII